MHAAAHFVHLFDQRLDITVVMKEINVFGVHYQQRAEVVVKEELVVGARLLFDVIVRDAARLLQAALL